MVDNINLNPKVARRIIDTVGSNGTPPEYGFQFFTAGLEPYLSTIEEEYLSTFIKEGGSSFKMVIGIYGGGKTHFLYCIRDIAWKHNFVVAYVSLSPEECPFHKLELVYKTIVKNITPPLTPDEILNSYEKGIESIIKKWVAQRYQYLESLGHEDNEIYNIIKDDIDQIETESKSFSNAFKNACNAYLNRQEKELTQIVQWITGEGYDTRIHKKFQIYQRIDKTTAFQMIRSLVKLITNLGYSGLVILLDEAERIPSLTSKQTEIHLNNLREIIDECGHTSFQNTMFFYALPDENFLDGRTMTYEALKQRVEPVFSDINPAGVKIRLENLIKDEKEELKTLRLIGEKLKGIYEVAYNLKFDESNASKTIDTIAETVYKKRFGDIGYKRQFVQYLIRGFHYLKNKNQVPTLKELELE